MANLKKFLESNRDLEYVDILIPDLCNIFRGKRLPIADLNKLFVGEFQIPSSIMLLDITGEGSDPGGRGFSDGDPDVCVWPIKDTLVRIPWSDEPIGQVLGSLWELDGSPCSVDPRQVLNSVWQALVTDGLFPTVAFELEFYLVDADYPKTKQLRPPVLPGSKDRLHDTQVYSIRELEEISGFLGTVSKACMQQGIPLGAASAEYASGQYEINLHHTTDVLVAADQAMLMQRAVRAIAKKFDTLATFMAKPYKDSAGNGGHVHFGLQDESGLNIFDDGTERGTSLMRHAIGGLMHTLPEAMAFFAPNANSYRRFAPDMYVPVTPSWGYNNRSVALRVPGGDQSSRRIEHRVPGADVNPYLALAAIMAGVHYGIRNRIDPGPPSEGDEKRRAGLAFPATWELAFERLADAKVLPNYFGSDYVRLYRMTKEFEHNRFLREINPLELDWYLSPG